MPQDRDEGTRAHTRKCAKCGDWKSVKLFRRDAACRYGIRGECLACYNRNHSGVEERRRRVKSRTGVVQELPRFPGSAPTIALSRVRKLWTIPATDQDLWRCGVRLA